MTAHITMGIYPMFSSVRKLISRLELKGLEVKVAAGEECKRYLALAAYSFKSKLS